MFEPGDKVKCVKNGIYLTLGDIYSVIKTANYDNRNLIMVANKSGHFYDPSLFEKVVESKFKNGSRAWSPIHGWGTVSHVDFDKDYTLQVVFDNHGRIRYFTKDGMQDETALLPTLFLDEVKLEDWPNPPAKLDPRSLSIGQEIEVKLAGHEGWTKRLFAGVIFDKIWVFSAGKDVNSAKTLQNAVEFRLPVN